MTDINICKDFAVMQFKELRNEILDIKIRIIKLQVIGISTIPIIVGVGEKYDITAVLMVGPLITLTFGFMLIFEQGSLMRVGEYIKDIIEPVLTDKRFIGWEAWLQQDKRRRRAEIFFAWSVHIAFAVYFALTTWLAYNAIYKEIGQLVAVSGLGLYCGGFLITMYLLITNLRIGTGVSSQSG